MRFRSVTVLFSVVIKITHQSHPFLFDRKNTLLPHHTTATATATGTMPKLVAVTGTALASLLLLLLLLRTPSSAAAAATGPAPPYTNHTVGGPSGWFFDPKKSSPAADYSAWAKAQSFFLGDFLIFKTNTNMTVIQTNNETTYGLCDASEDGGSGTFEWSDAGRLGIGTSESVEVPLTEEGVNYFFSGAGDGVQCQKGMRFSIDVGKGRGLPAALSQPPPPPYAEPTAPPPPEAEGNVVGGSPKEESFYTGAAGGGGPGERNWWMVLGVLLVVLVREKLLL